MQFLDVLRAAGNIRSAFLALLDRLRDTARKYWGHVANTTSSFMARLADAVCRAWASMVKWADETLKAAIKTLARTNKAIVISLKIFISDARRLLGQAYSFVSNYMARLAGITLNGWASMVKWADETLKAAIKSMAIIIEKMQQSARAAHKTIIECCQRIKSEASTLWALYQSSYNEPNDIDEQLDRLIAESENISRDFHGANKLGSGLPNLSVSPPAITREDVMRELMKSNMMGEKIMNSNAEPLMEASPIISPSQDTMITPPIQETRTPFQETTPPIQEAGAQEAVTREDVMRELMKSNMLGEKIMKATSVPLKEAPPNKAQDTMITPPIQETKTQEAVTREDVMRELMKSNMLGEKIMKSAPQQPPIIEKASPILDDDPFKEESTPIPDYDPFAENELESPEPVKMDNEDLLTSLENEAAKVEAEDMGLDIMRDMKDKAITCEELESGLKDVLTIFRKARTARRKVKIEKRDAY